MTEGEKVAQAAFDKYGKWLDEWRKQYPNDERNDFELSFFYREERGNKED
jgi:hypothetical protein|tara:strand:+ start:7769 stop:7918 length:150 start_codon:yes stop_codon:yes gene_type:complete